MKEERKFVTMIVKSGRFVILTL